MKANLWQLNWENLFQSLGMQSKKGRNTPKILNLTNFRPNLRVDQVWMQFNWKFSSSIEAYHECVDIEYLPFYVYLNNSHVMPWMFAMIV